MLSLLLRRLTFNNFSMLAKKEFYKILSIAFSQGLNYLFPVLIMPLASNKLGIQPFGKSLYAYYFVFYFSIVINYGFDISGSNLIAKMKSNLKLNKTSSLIYSSKLLLFIIATIIFMFFLFFYPKVSDEKLLFLSSYIYAFASLLIPSWLFIGKSDFFIYNTYQAISKLLFLLLVFFFVNESEDYILFNFFQSITYFGLAIYLVYYSKKKYSIKFEFVGFRLICFFLKTRSFMFFNTLSIFLYTSMNQILIGTLSTFENTSLYTVSARILTGYVALFIFPLGIYFLPLVSQKINENYKTGLVYILKISRLYFVIGIITSIVFFFSHKFVINIFFGKDYEVLNDYLPVIVFIPLFISLSNLFGNITYSNIKKDKILLIFTSLVGVVSLLMNVTLLPLYGLKGAFYTWCVSEFLITLLCISFYLNYYININKN